MPDTAQNTIRDFWVANHTASEGIYSTYTRCPLVKCADGFEMSVQASSGHYCSPRSYEADGSYSSWEIGYPSEREDLIMERAEDASDPTGTVYGWVPTSVINEVIAKHGGLALAAEAA